MKKKLWAILAGFAILVSMTACGGSKTKETAAPAPKESAAPAVEKKSRP